MSFGKRQPGGSAAQALNMNVAVPHGHAVTESGESTGHPLRWFIGFVACAAMLYGLLTSYGPDVVRDHRLAGTWQTAYDLRAMEGKCERKNFVITFCSAKIKSVARPDQAPIPHRFMMLFTGGGGEALVPVRSTADRTAVSVFYAAETKLLNRTLSFVLSAVVMTLLCVVTLLGFWKSVN